MFFLSFALIFLGNSLQNIQNNQNSHQKYIRANDNYQDTAFDNSNYKEISPITSKVVFTRCTFTKIDASSSFSGAIVIKDNADVKITDCSFDSNKGTLSGGAIYVTVEKFEISGTKFINNEATAASNPEMRSKGGAIYYNKPSGTQSITSCTFENNKAGSEGGAIFVYYNTEKQGPLNIIDCTFTECSSTTSGGAISSGALVEGDTHDGDMEITGCTFTRCSSQYGGALSFIDGTTKGSEKKHITKCTFENNYAKTHGSCVRGFSYELSIEDCTFKNNKPDSSKGPATTFIYIEMNEKAPTIHNVVFESNDGSTIHILLKEIKDSIVIDQCIFKGYKEKSALFSISASEFSFEYCNFTDLSNGAISLEGDAKVTIDNCLFENNKANVNGSCIYSTSTNDLRITNCNFNNNAGQNSGGSIYAINANELSITKCNFNKDISANDGGAVYIGAKKISMSECIFRSCETTGSSAKGGALYIDAKQAISYYEIGSCHFYNCTSKFSAGAVFAYCKDVRTRTKEDDQGEYMIQLFTCNFTGCKSGSEGGAISSGIKNSNGSVDGDNDIRLIYCFFVECSSGKGGALYFQDGTKQGDEDTQISTCTFINCYATEGEGYAISCRSYRLTVSSCTFTQHKRTAEVDTVSILFIEMNEAEVSPTIGANKFINNGQVSSITINAAGDAKLENNIFSDYTESTIHTPIVDLDNWKVSGEVTFEGCEFYNNKETRCISMTQDTLKATISKCKFTNNSISEMRTVEGCGVCICITAEIEETKHECEVNECTFTNIEAKGHGGAIYGSSQAVNIKGCKFTNCHTSSEEKTDQGGAVCLAAMNAKSYESIENCVFEDCSSSYSGGALYVYCRDVSVNQGSHDNKYMIQLFQCNFTRCKSEVEGGAICSGMTYGEGDDKETEGDNDFMFSTCHFVECESGKGGALFFQDGTTTGDEETKLMSCTFTNCYAKEGEGYAVSCRSYQLTMSNCEFKEHKREEEVNTNSVLFIHLNEPEVSLELYNLKFLNNAQVSGITIKASNSVALKQCEFRDYNDDSRTPVISLDNWEVSGEVTFENCEFSNIKETRCISMTQDTLKAQISKCKFTNNSISEMRTVEPCGVCIYITAEIEETKHECEVNECTFTNIEARGHGGAIYGSSQAVNIKGCKFTNCHTSSEEKQDQGGAVCLAAMNAKSYESIENCVFEDCSSSYSGGALYVYCRDVSVNQGGHDDKYMIQLFQCNFTRCKSEVEGGAICSGMTYGEGDDKEIVGDNDFMFAICHFVECESGKGGALFFQDGTTTGEEETKISSCTFTNCYAKEGEGYAISCRSYQLLVSGCSFTQHNRENTDNSHCILYVEMNEKEVSPKLTFITFTNNSNVNSLTVKSGNSVSIDKLTFNNYQNAEFNNVPCISLDSWSITGTLTLQDCEFSDITNIQCISAIRNNFNTNANNCNFTNVKSVLPSGFILQYGACISSLSRLGNLVIEGCTFNNVEVIEGHGGAIYAFAESADIRKCKFTKCSVSSSSSGSTDEITPQGGAIYLDASEAKNEESISDCVFEDCSAIYSGGAIFVYCLDQNKTAGTKWAAIRLNQCNFTRCTSKIEGGAISSGIKITNSVVEGDDDFQIANCYFVECESGKGGALYFQDGTTVGDEETQIMTCTFISCFATEGEGHAISARSYQISIRYSTFTKHKKGNTESEYNCIVFVQTNEDNVSPSIDTLTFNDNTAVSGLIVRSVQLTTIKNLVFNNTADDQPCIDLDKWDTKKNVIIENSIFENIIDARCIMTIAKERKFQGIIRNCQFNNNRVTKNPRGGYLSGCGSCILCQNQGDLVVAHCNFTNNLAESRGGAVFAETNAVEISMCRFVKCEAAPYDEDGLGGGIYLNQTSHGDFEFCSGNIFINCTASYSGGGLFVYCRDVHTRKAREDDDNMYQIMILSCNFTGCTSYKEGGAISSGLYNEETKKSEGDNDLYIATCFFTKCESDKGGALYFQDGTVEGDEETHIYYCSFYDCYATGTKHEGFAIHCRSYRIFIENCEFFYHKLRPKDKTGSIAYIETNEEGVTPKLSSLLFHENGNMPSLVIRSNLPVTLSNSVFSSSPLHINDEWDVSQITFNSCQFQHNSGEKGGSVYISSSGKRTRRAKVLRNTSFIFDYCQFVNNTAKQGGAIYADSIESLTLTSCAFYNSTASENGGAVYTSVKSEVTKCNFSQTTSPKGAAIFAVLDDDINITDVTLEVAKDQGSAAILVSGGNSSKKLSFSGSGCFISSGNSTDKSSSFIEFDSNGIFDMSGDMCFSGSSDESIKLPTGTNVDDSWFNCNKCPAPPPVEEWKPSDRPPVINPTGPVEPPNETLPDDFGDSKSRSGKLSTGAIVGIVVGCVAFVAIIVFLVLFILMRRNRGPAPQPTDIVSQEVESENTNNSITTTPGAGLWPPDINDAGVYDDNQNDDPFVKEFDD